MALTPLLLIMKNFYDIENACLINLSNAGECWHMWTSDSFPIIFTNVDDFKAGMFIVGFALSLLPGLRLLTFELMSNHMHFTLAGSEAKCLEFFRLLVFYLARNFKGKGRTINFSGLDCRLRRLETIQDVRNVITYNNRNGYIVHPEHSPYSFPWGANSYYYMPYALKYYSECKQRIPVRARRDIIHSHDADHADGILAVDGCACPLSYCDISSGERMFRGAAHYFQEISRNIEGQKAIAKEIGESIFYTDDELFRIVSAMCRDKYGQAAPSLIPGSAKMEIAKYMHYEYNSNNKQICRMLKINDTVINSLFRQ